MKMKCTLNSLTFEEVYARCIEVAILGIDSLCYLLLNTCEY